MTFDLRVLDPYHVLPDTSKTSVVGYSEVMPTCHTHIQCKNQCQEQGNK